MSTIFNDPWSKLQNNDFDQLAHLFDLMVAGAEQNERDEAEEDMNLEEWDKFYDQRDDIS